MVITHHLFEREIVREFAEDLTFWFFFVKKKELQELLEKTKG